MLGTTVAALVQKYGADKFWRFKSSDGVFFHRGRNKFIFNDAAEVVGIMDLEPKKYEAGLVGINHGAPLYAITMMSYNAIETIDIEITEANFVSFTAGSADPIAIAGAVDIEHLDLITTDDTEESVVFANIATSQIKDVVIQNISANDAWILWGAVVGAATSSHTLLKGNGTITLQGTKAVHFSAINKDAGLNVALRITGNT